MSYPARFHVFKGGTLRRRWYFRLRGSNGETILQSQAYRSRDAAVDGVKSIKRLAPIANVIIEPVS